MLTDVSVMLRDGVEFEDLGAEYFLHTSTSISRSGYFDAFTTLALRCNVA